ncbi:MULTISPECIES: DinB family protein [Heyndrickxia]|jgi:uncharacterized damage-inducible protein DinB|uniref:DinB family protein n=1 Tax=Heyndrickxia TaxID=2837504 RepID=UPI00242F5414|nr:DinB family protein [Heyndrickxia oleronia]MCI1593427.1 DinB family protein [Heyndrickxia oleronia]MCI1615155.1 DinB family protein [Heyndrickxia oleronia]MCI1763369.1 DinB family protein [Heyndrickxia oleronia]
MERKEFLLEQMRACHNESGWFASLNDALNGLDDADAVNKDADKTNSIKEIIQHLLFWNELYLKRFQGKIVNKEDIMNDQTFIYKNDSDWKSILQQFNEILKQWEEEISNCHETKLDSSPPHDSNSTWWEVLLNIPIHHAYHIGQIVHIRKSQGNWDTMNGVN